MAHWTGSSWFCFAIGIMKLYYRDAIQLCSYHYYTVDFSSIRVSLIQYSEHIVSTTCEWPIWCFQDPCKEPHFSCNSRLAISMVMRYIALYILSQYYVVRTCQCHHDGLMEGKWPTPKQHRTTHKRYAGTSQTTKRVNPSQSRCTARHCSS